jgi:hypothetical protein
MFGAPNGGRTLDERTTEGSASTALPKNAAASLKKDERPTHDQLYLMDKINFFTERGQLTIPAIQRLNRKYGVAPVVSSMRILRQSAPGHVLGVRSAYSYLVSMCEAFT